jgi:hypothetical protein
MQLKPEHWNALATIISAIIKTAGAYLLARLTGD